MTILQALVKAHGRLKDAPPIGYSGEKIGFVIVLDAEGQPQGKPVDIRAGEGRKRVGRTMVVPASAKRTSAVLPNLLWDKTAYALGVTAADGRGLEAKHAAFVAHHRDLLAGTTDPGLLALLRFVETWQPPQFAHRGWPEEMKDENVVFSLGHDYLSHHYIHDRPAARALLARISAAGEEPEAVCLVTGERAPVARLHPAIKGVWGAQSSGASIVSFNQDAFTSYGHDQGANAPVSASAAAAYTAVLNRFLQRDSGHRIQIGDASTVYWADAQDADAALLAQDTFAAVLGGYDEEKQARGVGGALEALKNGRLIEARPELGPGVRFHVLGLAPNAARVSVRFWIDDDFGVIARRLARHVEAMRIEPPPPQATPSLWLCLLETAVLRKTENVPPQLAGEWLRSILTGAPYPPILQSTLLMRIRADKKVGALRAAMLKACLVTRDKEVPVALDPTCTNKGYLLGRLFAVYERIQTAALGDVNATIRDKFYGSASATPRKVFPLIDKGAMNHLSKVARDNRGRAVNLEKTLAELMGALAPASDPFPNALAADEQALFAVGYYHQKSDFFRPHESATADGPHGALGTTRESDSAGARA